GAGGRAAVWGGARGGGAGGGGPARPRGALRREPLWLDTACLTEARMREFHDALRRYRPRVILGYARSAALFARFLRARGLEPYRPHSLVTSAEVLEPEDRAVLEEVFGCPVFNRYGCREVSVVASEC